MNFEKDFSWKIFLNLARRQDRRTVTEVQFRRQGMVVQRFPAMDAKRLRQTRGYETHGRYAHALTVRLALRRAWQSGAESLLIFEDDVVLCQDFIARVEELELPADWGMFYFGCQHHERPQAVTPGVVRVKFALDTHAVAIRRPHFRRIMRALSGGGKRRAVALPATDVVLAGLHGEIPSYAAYPNLAWQSEDESDIALGKYSNYEPAGEARPFPPATAGLDAETLGGRAWCGVRRDAISQGRWMFAHQFPHCVPQPAPGSVIHKKASVPGKQSPKPAFLFLTRQARNHPEIWREFFASAGAGNYSTYGHAAERIHLATTDAELHHCQIAAHQPTRWADVSLVRAQLALLQGALKDAANTHFVFHSESCIPIRPFRDFTRLLSIDGRSRFGWSRHKEIQEQKGDPGKADRALAVPKITPGVWRFHSQWILLNREAAELVVEDDFTPLFENVFAPDECYFGTVLNMKGYPLETKVAAKDITWVNWNNATGGHPNDYGSIDSAQAGELLGSGCYFARKFRNGSNVKDFGLHEA